MNISVFGLGYVGTVSAACLASQGHKVVGVDPVLLKTRMINQGKAPIIEKDIEGMIRSAVADGRLQAVDSVEDAVRQSQISIVCVGTPSLPNGNIDTRYVKRVCEHIGNALQHTKDRHVVVIRSTVLPGTIQDIVVPTLENASKKKAISDFGVCHNPEFLREGTAVYDYFHPPKTVIGQMDTQSGDMVADLYAGLDAPMFRTAIRTAEMVKYTDNAWHALKVGFANEIGRICKSRAMDSHEVMDVFLADTKLNISPQYLKPGFAFGGSCLPKDLRALTHKGKTLDLELPILNAILPSNRNQVATGLNMILAEGNRKIGILGFSFKAGTDDLRESPMVEIIERLLGKGFDIRLYDRNVNLAALHGANKDFINDKIPHITRLLVSTPQEVLGFAQTLVFGNNDPEFKNIADEFSGEQAVIDLVRAIEDRKSDDTYKGMSW